MGKTDLSNLERIIRKQLPGNGFAKARKIVREICEGNDYVGHALELRQLAANRHAVIPPHVCLALADELDRIAADRAKTLAQNAEIAKAQKNGCPFCSAAIRRNSSLAGWYQCGQYGAIGFRADNSKPACSWQAFHVEVK